MGATVRVAIIRHLKNGIYVFCTLAKFCEPNLSVEQALTWYGSIASRTLGSMGVVDCASKYKGFISGSGTEERRAAEVLGATRGTRRQRSRAGNIFSAICCFKSMLAMLLKLLLNFTVWFTKHSRVQQAFVWGHRETQFVVFEIQNPQSEFHIGCT